MSTIQPHKNNFGRVMWLAVGLAVIAALAYVLIAWRILAVGDLSVAEKPEAIVYIAAACYLIGGLLILVRRRWLWMVGVGINSLVIVFFLTMYQNRPAVMFSPGGMVTKAAQLLLELVLIYLIVADWQSARRPTA